MEKQLIEKVVEEAKGDGSNLVIWDRRDTFTVESDAVKQIEVNDDTCASRCRMARPSST